MPKNHGFGSGFGNRPNTKHDPNSVYLGVTLDWTLSYKEHLSKTAAKLKSQNNLLSKLAGSSWGAYTKTLRTSVLALCYSVAEYCCPAWSRSSHTVSIDSQLNNTMRLISGCVRPTQTPWLPVLVNIAPHVFAIRSGHYMLLLQTILCNDLHLVTPFGQKQHRST